MTPKELRISRYDYNLGLKVSGFFIGFYLFISEILPRKPVLMNYYQSEFHFTYETPTQESYGISSNTAFSPPKGLTEDRSTQFFVQCLSFLIQSSA